MGWSMHVRAKGYALSRKLARYATPRNRLIGKSFVVCAMSIANIAQVFTNLHDHRDQAIVFGVMSAIMCLCLCVLLKVGYKTLPEKIRAYEGLPDPFCDVGTAVADASGGYRARYTARTADEVCYVAAGEYRVNSSFSPVCSPSTLDTSDVSSLSTLDGVVRTRTAKSERAAKTKYHYQQCGSTPVSVGEDIAITSDDPSHPLNACFFRRNPKPVMAFGLVGLFAFVNVAIYYLTLGIRMHQQFSLSAFQDTLYLCFILYLVCGKWCMIVVSLMAGLRKDAALCADGTLFLVEAEQKDGERLRREVQDLKYRVNCNTDGSTCIQ